MPRLKALSQVSHEKGCSPRVNLNAMKGGMVLGIYEFTQQTSPVRTPRGKEVIAKERPTHPVRTLIQKDMITKKSDFYTPPIYF